MKDYDENNYKASETLADFIINSIKTAYDEAKAESEAKNEYTYKKTSLAIINAGDEYYYGNANAGITIHPEVLPVTAVFVDEKEGYAVFRFNSSGEILALNSRDIAEHIYKCEKKDTENIVAKEKLENIGLDTSKFIYDPARDSYFFGITTNGNAQLVYLDSTKVTAPHLEGVTYVNYLG